MKLRIVWSLPLAVVILWALTGCSPVSPPVEQQSATQTSLAASATSSTDTPEPAPTETSQPPARMEQQSFEGVSFAYSPDLIAGVEPEILPAAAWSPLSLRQTDPPTGTLTGVPDSIRIRLEPAAGATSTGEFVVHPVRDASGQVFPALEVYEAVPASLEELQNSLPSGGLPASFFSENSGAWLEARTHRVNFQNGSGFSTLSYYAQSETAEGSGEADLHYVFEGITSSGDYYVALRFPVTAPGVELPGAANGGEPAAEMIAQAAGELTELTAGDFVPDLEMLDIMVASLRVEPTLPAPPTVTPEPDCVNRAEFVAESVEDGTVFAPGETFQQTWTLRNAGTCTWSPEYRLLFEEGDPLGYSNEDPVRLPQPIAPGETVDVSADLTSPQEEGRYEADFLLQDPEGESFGVGAGTPFWVSISVVTIAADLDLGAPDYLDSFEGDRGDWFLGGIEVQSSLEEGALVMKAVEPVGDRWRVTERPVLGDFYIEMRVETGESCSGKDSYGWLLRAPEAEDNVIDSGYVIGFSCDGMLRVYRMDDGQYVSIRDWFKVPTISPGGASHRIGVRAEDSEFQIFVDGTEVFSFTDGTYGFGKFGLMIRAVGENDFSYSVDEMAYWLLP